ncbi:hypothetical protein QJS10_CPA02g00437 [Acorus calamus]|uniref:Uncharacterized protein n=1 Tax=Acorus calamus TaxID=4465 RepID=A0AAV9FG48_ACOCL|nr:hypothetical protein QJS10_CPA02g00437 [Acorus calamus]
MIVNPIENDLKPFMTMASARGTRNGGRQSRPGVQFPGPIGLEDVFMDDFMVSDQLQIVATAVGDANGEAFWAAPPGCSSAVPDSNEWQSTVEIDGVNFQPEFDRANVDHSISSRQSVRRTGMLDLTLPMSNYGN